MAFNGQGTNISQADDVYFSNLAHGNTMSYNGATKKWNNVAGGVSAGGIGSLGLVVAASNSPASVKAVADYVCDGTGDEVQINQAILAAIPLHGYVQLASGTFYTAAPINMYGHVKLSGVSRSGTVITPASNHTAIANEGSGIVVFFDPASRPYELSGLSDLTIFGNWRDLNALRANATRPNQSGVGALNIANSPDDRFIVERVNIVSCARRAVYITTPSGMISTTWYFNSVSAWDNGKSSTASIGYAGFDIQVTDAWFNECDVGSQGDNGTTTAHGFVVRGSVVAFSNCIAWLSNGSGFVLRGTRNTFTGCHSHHNDVHGFDIIYGNNTLTGCMSNNNLNDGFRIASNNIVCTGCQSFNIVESGSSRAPQKTGWNITSSVLYGIIVQGTAFGIGMNPVAGTVPTGAEVLVIFSGDTSDAPGAGSRRVIRHSAV